MIVVIDVRNGWWKWSEKFDFGNCCDGMGIGLGIGLDGNMLVIVSVYGFVVVFDVSNGIELWWMFMEVLMIGLLMIKDGCVFVLLNNNEVFVMDFVIGSIFWFD